MTLDAHRTRNQTRAVSERLRELDVTDSMILCLVLLNLADLVVTIPNWHLEGNPILLSAGVALTVVLKVTPCIVWLWAWFVSGLRDSPLRWIAAVFAWLLLFLYCFVLGTNVAVLLS